MSEPVTAEELSELDPAMGTIQDWIEEIHFLAENGYRIVRVEE